jgi:hypothetical protein
MSAPAKRLSSLRFVAPLAAIAFVLATWSSISLAEVPEHAPSLDKDCPQGFQWSRGPVACKQADCPAGAGRTYTYDCNCGEAWDKPFRTCVDPKRAGFVTHCVPKGEACSEGELTDAKVGAVAVGGIGGFILLNTGRIAVAGSGPVGWGLVIGGAAVGYAWWLWKNGRPRGLNIGKITERAIQQATSKARTAVDNLNRNMRGGMTDDDLAELQVFYEKWLNVDPAERQALREQMASEGVDMIKLGEAIRWYKKTGGE